MLTNLVNVLRDEEGATLVEYGLLVSLIAVVCIATLQLLGPNIKNMFVKVNAAV